MWCRGVATPNHSTRYYAGAARGILALHAPLRFSLFLHARGPSRLVEQLERVLAHEGGEARGYPPREFRVRAQLRQVRAHQRKDLQRHARRFGGGVLA